MKEFYLHFVSVARSDYAREIPFRIKIEADNEKDAKLIGDRMRGEPTWRFDYVEAVD